MSCGCNGASNLPSIKFQDLFNLQERTKKRVPTQDLALTVVRTPKGTPFYTVTSGVPTGWGNDWTVSMDVEIKPYYCTIIFTYSAGTRQLTVDATITADHEDTYKIHYVLQLPGEAAINKISYFSQEPIITRTNPNPHLTPLDNCRADCIGRHAPSCFGVCVDDPTGWLCIGCAGGSIVCCIINCSC